MDRVIFAVQSRKKRRIVQIVFVFMILERGGISYSRGDMNDFVRCPGDGKRCPEKGGGCRRDVQEMGGEVSGKWLCDGIGLS